MYKTKTESQTSKTNSWSPKRKQSHGNEDLKHQTLQPGDFIHWKRHLESPLSDPNRKRHTLHLWQEVTLLYYHCKEEERLFFFSLPGNSSANEKPLYFKLSDFLSGLFVYNSPPNFPISSIGEFPLLPSTTKFPTLSWVFSLSMSFLKRDAKMRWREQARFSNAFIMNTYGQFQ